ncbi:MAG: hypothetical protein J7J92_03390, partial [Candidatus Aenigmarchaeota archaeon]|nr:hypothetical protein [Candidatus Aenigmarchaeota archaeon]
MMFGKKGKKTFALFVCFLFLLMPVTTAESISEIFGRGVLNFTSQKEELNVNDLAIKLMEAKGDEVLDFLSEPTLLCTKHGSDESLESSSGVYRFACIYFSSKKNELRFSLDNSKFLGFIPSDPDALKLKRNYKNKVAFSVQTSPEFSDRVVFSLFFSSSSADPQLTFSCKKGRIVFLDNMDDFEQFIELMHNYELLLFSKHDFESKTGKEAILNYGLKNIDTNDPNVLRLMKSLTQNNLASLVRSPLYVPTESGIYKFNLMGSMVIVEKNKKIVGTADYVYYLLPGDNPPSSLPTPLSKEKTPTAFFTADEKLTENYLGYYNYEIPSSNFEDNQLTTAGTITGMFIKEKINAFLAWIRNLFAKKASFELVNHTGNETKKLVSLDVYPSSIVNWNKIPPSVLISLEDKMDYYSRYPEKIPLNRDIDLGEGYSIRFLTSSDIEKAEGPTGYAIVAGKEIPDFLEIKGPMEITYASVDVRLQLSSVALKNLGFSEKEITDIVGAGNYITVSISGDSDMVKIGNKELNIDKVLSDKNKIIISTGSNTEEVKGLTLPIIRTEKVGDIEFSYVGGTLAAIDGKFVVPETGYNIYPGDYKAIKNKLDAVFREAQSMKVDLNKIELEGILPDDIKLLRTNLAEIFGSSSDLILIFGAKEMGDYLGLESILPGGKSFIAIKTSDGKTILDTFSTLLHEILHAWKSRSLISQTTILSEINSFTMEENNWEKLAVMGSGDKAYFRMSDETFNGYRHKGADIPYGMRKLYPAYTYIYDTYGDAGVKQLNEILIKKPGLYNFVQYEFGRSFQKAILMTAYNGGSRDEFINLLRKYIKKGIANWNVLEFFDNNEIEKFTDDYINYLLKNGKIVSSEAEFNEFIKELKGTDVYEAFSRGMKPGFFDKFLTSEVLEKLKNKKIDEFLWFLYEGKTIIRTDELLKDFKDLKKLSPEKISEFFNLMKKVDVKENRVLYVSFHCDETLKNLAYEVEDGKKFINLVKVKSFIDEDSLGETKIFLPAISKEQDGKLFVYVAEKNRLLVTSKNGREVYFIGKIDLNKELSEPISIKTSDSNNFKLISVETGRAVGFWLSDDNLEVVYSPGKITTSGFKADWKTPKTLSLQDALKGELSCGMYKFKPTVAKEEDLWGAISNPRNWEKEPGIKIWANEKIDEKNFRKLNMQFDEKTKTVTVADTFVVKQMTNEEMLTAAGKDALMEDIFGIEYELHPEKFKTYAEELSVKAENGKIIIEDPHGTGKFAEVSSGGKIEIKFSPKLTGGVPNAVSKAKIGAMKSAAYHYFNTELGKNVPMEKIKINLKNRVAFAPDWTAIKFDDTTYRKVIGFKKPDDVKAEILEKIKPYLERYGFDPEKQKIGLHFETQKVIVYHEYIDPQTGEKIKLGDYDISLETGKVKWYDGAKVDSELESLGEHLAGTDKIKVDDVWKILEGPDELKGLVKDLSYEQWKTILNGGEVKVGDKLVSADNIILPPEGAKFDTQTGKILPGIKLELQVRKPSWIQFTDYEGQTFLISPEAIKKAKMFAATTEGETFGCFIGPKEPVKINGKNYHLVTDVKLYYGGVAHGSLGVDASVKFPTDFEIKFYYHSHPSKKIVDALAAKKFYAPSKFKYDAYLSSADIDTFFAKHFGLETRSSAHVMISSASSQVKIFDKWKGYDEKYDYADLYSNNKLRLEWVKEVNEKGVIKSFNLDGSVYNTKFDDLTFDKLVEKMKQKGFNVQIVEMKAKPQQDYLSDGIVARRLAIAPEKSFYDGGELNGIRNVIIKGANKENPINFIPLTSKYPTSDMYQLVKVESVKKIGGKSSIYTFNYGSNLDGEEVVKNIDG